MGNVVIGICLIGVIVYIVYAMVKSNAPTPQTRAALRQLTQIERTFPVPPYARRVGSHDIVRPSAIAIGAEMESNRDINTIYAYYSAELTKRGWKYCGPPPDPNAVPDNNFFERGPYEAALQFSPENTGRYTFAFEWGVNACRQT